MSHAINAIMAANDVLEVLDRTDPADAVAFRDALQHALRVLPIEQVDLAELFDVSTATVSRWVNGKNTTYPVVRQVALERLRKSVEKHRAKAREPEFA